MPAGPAFAMRPGQAHHQIRPVIVNPLIDAFWADGGKIRPLTFKPTGDQLRRPTKPQQAYHFLMQGGAFEPRSSVTLDQEAVGLFLGSRGIVTPPGAAAF